MTPPSDKEVSDFPNLVRYEFSIKEKTDIVYSGLGWIRVQGSKDNSVKIAAWAPEGVSIMLRKALI